MAYVNSFRATSSTYTGIAGFFANIAESVARYRVYRETTIELNELSDRDLADLGLSRSAIKSVAYEAAYGN